MLKCLKSKKDDTVVKKEKLQQIYAIVISVLVIAMGVAFVCVTAEIYYSNRDSSVIFTQEIVVQRLRILAVPFGLLVVAIALGVAFPLYETRVKVTSEHTARLLASKLPSEGEGEEYEKALANYNKLNKLRIVLWAVTGALLLACTIAVLCYMLNSANFLSDDITADIFALLQNVLPWIVVAFVVLIAFAVLSNVIASRRVREIKTLIKLGSGQAVGLQELQFVSALRGLLSNNITLWVIRGIIFVVGVTFLILGILNGGANDVLIKAINICTECIGLG